MVHLCLQFTLFYKLSIVLFVYVMCALSHFD